MPLFGIAGYSSYSSAGPYLPSASPSLAAVSFITFYQCVLVSRCPIWSEASINVLCMTFLQPIGEFPQTWYLEIFYFIMPVIGLIIVAQGIADFGYMFFNRRTRRKEWQMAVATFYKDHIILIGLGHLGYRIVLNLINLDQDVVVIEHNPFRQID